MKKIRYAVTLLLVAFNITVFATPIPNFGKSITWEVKGESPSLNNMKGKSVLVLFFQDWCGICNGWSPNLFKQVDAAYATDPKVIIVALKTDGGSVSDARKYIESGTSAKNWIIGVDEGAEYYKKVLGHDKLFYYAWVKPDGTVGKSDHSGSDHTKGSEKIFVMANDKSKRMFKDEVSFLLKIQITMMKS